MATAISASSIYARPAEVARANLQQWLHPSDGHQHVGVQTMRCQRFDRSIILKPTSQGRLSKKCQPVNFAVFRRDVHTFTRISVMAKCWLLGQSNNSRGRSPEPLKEIKSPGFLYLPDIPSQIDNPQLPIPISPPLVAYIQAKRLVGYHWYHTVYVCEISSFDCLSAHSCC